MGLFFNYDKPGPGIEKDGPKKKGLFLYLELFWRKLGKLFLSNMLYVAVSVPVILAYHFMAFYVLSAIMPAELVANNTVFNQLVLIMTVILTVFWGTGPISCGYAFLMRNFAREEHVWMVSDFFEHTKKNFKQSLIIFIIDMVVLITGVNAIYFYFKISEAVPALGYVAYFLVCVMMILTMMHFYLYEFLVTFDLRIIDAYKNSVIMTFAALPMNIFLMVFVIAITYLLFSILTPIAILLVTALFWVSFMRFPIDFFAARIIKRELIDRKESDK